MFLTFNSVKVGRAQQQKNQNFTLRTIQIQTYEICINSLVINFEFTWNLYGI